MLRRLDDAGALCLLVIAKGVVSSHALPESGSVVIGRAEACDVRIDDPSISRRHATLHVVARSAAGERRRRPRLFIEDMGSANGTLLRGPQAAPLLPRSADAPPESVRGDRLAVPLASGERTAIGIGDFLDLGSTLLVVWPASSPPERAAVPSRRAGIVVKDPAMRRLHEILARIAPGDISVVLLGETGVGKEVVAQTIHELSPRRGRPFVGLNCAAFSETLLESELFGHERGAFTGAVQAKAGLLETADGGTVFLDEVAEMPVSLQAKLLRVLEEREVLRIGSLRPRPIDVRFVAATNRDLEAHVTRGLFRQDLYFRLNGITLVVPPLRERLVELPELARTFVADAAKNQGLGRAPELSLSALAALERHRWPGNIRELRNVIDRAVLLSDGNRLSPEHLSIPAVPPAPPTPVYPPVRSDASTPGPPMVGPVLRSGSVPEAAPSGSRLRSEVEAYERERIIVALEQCGGNQTRAARMLGISRRTLTNRLGQYELPRPRKR